MALLIRNNQNKSVSFEIAFYYPLANLNVLEPLLYFLNAFVSLEFIQPFKVSFHELLLVVQDLFKRAVVFLFLLWAYIHTQCRISLLCLFQCN